MSCGAALPSLCFHFIVYLLPPVRILAGCENIIVHLGFIQLVAPFAPHIAEELWAKFGEKSSITLAPFPVCDESRLHTNTVKIAVQVNGKLRAEMQISKDAKKEDALEQAKALEGVKRHIEGKQIIKEIFVPAKIVNIVAK